MPLQTLISFRSHQQQNFSLSTMPAMNRRLGRDHLHRFLRPGALARLRDSRVSAWSPRSGPKTPFVFPSFPPSSPLPSPDQIDGFPCFAVRTSGPRHPQRKRLAASKSFFLAPSLTTPSSPDPSDQVLDFIGGVPDLLVAH